VVFPHQQSTSWRRLTNSSHHPHRAKPAKYKPRAASSGALGGALRVTPPTLQSGARFVRAPTSRPTLSQSTGRAGRPPFFFQPLNYRGLSPRKGRPPFIAARAHQAQARSAV